ncbi:MAG TPA: SDR family NAD(P)-dependent oxidoreductase [Fimbriimonadaceae bacterium]|nr:SDR family NAD(P)-dependent oxidoreductase [Fimbriimonadaceae bacterium]
MKAYRHAIVIGASSGIGAELVRQLARTGCHVAAVARRVKELKALHDEDPEHIHIYVHDVKDHAHVPGLFQGITQKLGGLDLMIYAAGVMPKVEPNEFNFDKDREMIEVNLVGLIAWMNLAATRFRYTQHGTLVAVGSVAGDRGRAGQPVYNTTKAALATYMEALRNRLSRHGVKVVTVKPGPTRTEMTSHLNAKGMMAPADVARIILKKSHRTGEHYVKLTHAVAFWIIRHIPSVVFRKMKV